MQDLDLFSGARGWEASSTDLVDALGIETAGNAVATSNAAGFRTIQADVAAIEPRDLGPIRGLIASPPCQTFSMAGNGAGRRALTEVLQAVKAVAAGEWPSELIASTGDVRTGLVIQPLRYALALQPEWIAWEQVPTVLPAWEACADVLRENGYSASTAVLNAEQYGVPQTRRRAVLVARLNGEARLPTPTHSRYYSRNPGKLDTGVRKWVSMAEALGWDEGGYVGFPRRADKQGDVLTLDGVDYRARDLRPTGEPAQTVTEKARSWSRWALRNGNQANSPVRTVNEPAATLAFGHNAARFEWTSQFSHDSERVTTAEAAALQTFPEGHPFQGPQTRRFQQIGNAVPPLLGRAILETLLR